ncbi:MAG: FMN-binding protein [Proteobacteria bacterium]|nr:FMN-binding protein [Pseudomonadota bacterium]
MGLTSTLQAKGVYQTPEKFLSLTFSEVPEAQRILLTGDLAKRVKTILGHRYKKIRVPYWQQGCRSAWILEEIGKERFITTGFVVNSGGLEKVKVLIFRESRGWEVKHDYFGKQFIDARLSGSKLTKRIDNISGATLSVRAVTKLSKMALMLHDHVTEGSC